MSFPLAVWGPCPTCGGTGLVGGVVCAACGGLKQVIGHIDGDTANRYGGDFIPGPPPPDPTP